MVVGKTTTPYIAEGIDEYTRRVERFVPFNIHVIPDLKNAGKLSTLKQKEMEGAKILESLTPGDCVILLDEHGKELTSRELSAFIERKSVEVSGRLVFVVGGPYGFSDEVYQRANGKLSLSRLTFPHELVRLFFVEQLYRAYTIARSMPYHHD